MNWKFKINDIIWPADSDWPEPIIAKVIDQRDQGKPLGLEYYLLWFDGSSGWTSKKFLEQDYKKLDWDIKFFDLFVLCKVQFKNGKIT